MNSNDLIFTVTDLNRYVKSLLERDENLNYVFVVGEISNFIAHRSGHFYLSLKDAGGAIKAVMFKVSTGRLAFRPRDGLRVICRGRVSLYEAAGSYQFYIDDMQPDGAGSLAVAFEQLKAKLAAEGLFDAERKRPLPLYPAAVALITSPTGAALQDMLNILGRRFPCCMVLHRPAQMQGEGAAADLAAAIAAVNADGRAEVIIIGRGGGSTEDLWAFNDEALARAVSASNIPVISAVGHETDFTICDFVADLRAPTPSAAAELCVPDMTEVSGLLAGYRMRLMNAAASEIRSRRYELEMIKRSAALSAPRNYTDQLRLRLHLAEQRLTASLAGCVSAERQRLARLAAALESLSPLRVLARGYAAVRKGNETVRAASALRSGDRVKLLFADGETGAVIEIAD